MARAEYTLENLNVPVCVGLLVTHLLAFPAPFFWSWPAFWASFFMGVTTLWVGIGAGNHRLFTHNGYKAVRWLFITIAVIATLAGQGGIIFWVGVHLLHHTYADKPQDPHSPRDGGWWAHMLWLCFKRVYDENPLRQKPELWEDPVIVWLERYSWVPQAILAVVVFVVGYLLGGIREAVAWVLWCMGVRPFITYHVTWFVNSGCHMPKLGYKNTKVSDHDAVNVWWFFPLAGGENFHENHHEDRRAASHGWHWWEFDIIYWIIVVWSWFGWVSDIILPRTRRKKPALV